MGKSPAVAGGLVDAHKMVQLILGEELNTKGVEGLVCAYGEMVEADRGLLFALLAITANQHSSYLLTQISQIQAKRGE